MGWYLYLTQNQNRYETITEPHTDGFWAEDIPSTNPQGRLSFTEQTMNGRTYNVALLFKKALFPLSAGKLTVTPMEAEVSQVDFFGTPVRARRLKTDPLIIEAMPLPRAGEPAGFDPSNVGKYEISAGVDRGVGRGGRRRHAADRRQGRRQRPQRPRAGAARAGRLEELRAEGRRGGRRGRRGHRHEDRRVAAARRAPREDDRAGAGAGHVRSGGATLRDGPHRAHRAGRHGRGVQRARRQRTRRRRRQPAATRRRRAIRPIHARGGLSAGAGAAFLHSGAFTATWWCRPWRGRCCWGSGGRAPACPPTSRATGAGACAA